MSNDVIKNHLRTALALLDLPPGVEAEDAREAADAIRAAVIEHGRPVEGDSFVDTIRRMAAERDAAIAARDEAVANLETVARVRDAWIAGARRMAAHRAAAERARDEVGIQLAAAQERIKLLEKVAKEARAVLEDHDRSMIHLDDAVSALDAVPGDALAPRITAALEASGIDSANVKGGE